MKLDSSMYNKEKKHKKVRGGEKTNKKKRIKGHKN
jgi:hypothetical protein